MVSLPINNASPCPEGDAHRNTKGAPHGTSHTNCLAVECSALSAELGIDPGWGLRIPIHAGH